GQAQSLAGLAFVFLLARWREAVRQLRTMPGDERAPGELAARTYARLRADGDVLGAEPAHAHSSAHRLGEHAAHRASASGAAAELCFSRRQRYARLGDGPSLGVRRYHRARSVERQR